MKKFTIFALISTVLLGCGEGAGDGGGKGGLPISLNEHAKMICDGSWEGMNAVVENATGQQKEELKEELKKYSKAKICECIQSAVAKGDFNYEGNTYNDVIHESRKNGQLEGMYSSFKKYKFDDVSPKYQLLYTAMARNFIAVTEVCVQGGFDESKIRMR